MRTTRTSWTTTQSFVVFTTALRGVGNLGQISGTLSEPGGSGRLASFVTCN
jgi:hypothetical protein